MVRKMLSAILVARMEAVGVAGDGMSALSGVD